ncbi:hypothetical protein Q8F55_008319 [Vanrija albida]|uniref:Uncharacterized protein n=1 Tax=Vanrija albida TaxID=181172 RepID=A0ABR3PVW9_9TREE
MFDSNAIYPPHAGMGSFGWLKDTTKMNGIVTQQDVDAAFNSDRSVDPDYRIRVIHTYLDTKFQRYGNKLYLGPKLELLEIKYPHFADTFHAARHTWRLSPSTILAPQPVHNIEAVELHDGTSLDDLDYELGHVESNPFPLDLLEDGLTQPLSPATSNSSASSSPTKSGGFLRHLAYDLPVAQAHHEAVPHVRAPDPMTSAFATPIPINGGRRRSSLMTRLAALRAKHDEHEGQA